jgi:hypothetical protein
LSEPDLSAAVALLDPAARGWSAAELDPAELVDDAWIEANTRPGRAPSRARAVGGRLLAAVRTIGVDPLEGVAPDVAVAGHPLLSALPRPIRRTLIQRGGLTRDQMRRIAARTGYPYTEAWSPHNKGAMKGVWGALVHHTGTSWSAAGDYPTLRVVRDGRPGLVNSLSGFGLGRSGTIYLISEKLSWHAGVGEYNGLTDGNGYLVGIEAESDGRSWTDAERDAYPRLVASLLIEIGQGDPRPGVGDRWTTRHASWALPRGRKTDAAGLDMDRFWAQVYAYLADPASIHRDHGKAPAPVAPTGQHTVVSGDTLYALARRYGVTVAQLRDWNGLTSDLLTVGQVLRVTATAPVPPPVPPVPAVPPVPPVPPVPGLPGWPADRMGRTGFFGLRSDPNPDSHGGFYAWERPYVNAAKQRLVAKGFVPGITDWRDPWASDGVYDKRLFDAVARWQGTVAKDSTTYWGGLFADDWARLAR